MHKPILWNSPCIVYILHEFDLEDPTITQQSFIAVGCLIQNIFCGSCALKKCRKIAIPLMFFPGIFILLQKAWMTFPQLWLTTGITNQWPESERRIRFRNIFYSLWGRCIAYPVKKGFKGKYVSNCGNSDTSTYSIGIV